MLEKISVVIPTLNGEKELRNLLPKLMNSRLKTDILIIDSSSEDATVEVAISYGVRVKVIDKNSFNHGLTREFARQILGGDIVVYLTQDASPFEEDALEKLIAPLISGEAAIAYGRQHPKDDAPFFEQFLRRFNYPEKSEIRSNKDFIERGSAAYFCSNSFAAYTNSALDQIGGFSKVFFGEDTLAAAELLNKGYRMAYVAEAGVVHSHNLSFWEEFSRYRLMGKERRRYPQYFGSGEKRLGFIFAKNLFKEAPVIYWPYAFIYLAVKGLGFFTSFL